MAQAYFSLVTTAGRNKLAASAAGGPAVSITHFAIGDGNGADTNPTAASTALVREVWRTPVESVVVDPDNPSAVLVTAIIPTTAGGWWMREFGVFDNAGTMIAVARPVSQYKPTALEGQLEDIRYEFQIIVGETANVTLLVDPSVLLASRDWVMTRKIPMAQMMRTPWLPVVSMTVTAPPVAPAIGDTYLVPAGATGVWAANIGKLAEWTGSAWSYLTPPNGHGISLPDGRVSMRLDGAYVEKLALDSQSGKWNFAATSGTANDIVLTLTPVPLSLASLIGASIRFIANAANTGAVTVTVNGLAPKAAIKRGQVALGAGHWAAGDVVEIVYDGIRYQVVSVTSPSSDDVVKDALYPQMYLPNAANFTSAAGVVTAFTNWGVPTGNPAVIAAFNPANSLLTIPAGLGGLWYVTGYANSVASGNTPVNGHGMRLYKGGIASGYLVSANSSPGNSIVQVQVNALLTLNDGDTLQLANLANNNGVGLSYFSFSASRFGRAS